MHRSPKTCFKPVFFQFNNPRLLQMNPIYPSMSQLKHDAFYTTLSSVIAAIIEIMLCHGWASGHPSMERNLTDRNFTKNFPIFLIGANGYNIGSDS